MEFFAAYFTSVPKSDAQHDPEAEHTAIIRGLEYMVLAEEAGFKYLLSPEHHFLDEYSHTGGNFPVFGYLAAKTQRSTSSPGSSTRCRRSSIPCGSRRSSRCSTT